MPDEARKEAEAFLRAVFGILEEDVLFEIEPEGHDGLYVNLVGNVLTLPEERPVLAALQHLLRGAVHRKTGADLEIVLDANGSVKRRRAELIGLALSKAEDVVRERKRVQLNAMPAHERRMIHETLANYPGVRTYSVGTGDGRRVVMEPESDPEPGGE
ncbi:MAG: R3H domain-containing nucleic acid-binding protein [bacterium]